MYFPTNTRAKYQSRPVFILSNNHDPSLSNPMVETPQTSGMTHRHAEAEIGSSA